MFKKILSLFVFFSVFCSAQPIGPRVTVPKIDYDFSHISKGASISHTFVLYNGGGATLVMSDVRTSCKCITARLDKTTLAPTDSANLYVDYTNTGNSNSLDNYVSIKTNDPTNPNLRIFITRAVPRTGPTLSSMPIDTSAGGGVYPVLYFPETSHDFGQLKEGQIVDHVFKFYNKGSSVLKIGNIKTSCGCTAALVKSKELGPDREGELRVEFDSSGKSGKLSRSITVMSNDPREPAKVILIYADVIRK